MFVLYEELPKCRTAPTSDPPTALIAAVGGCRHRLTGTVCVCVFVHVQTYLKDANDLIYAYLWEHEIFNRSSRLGNIQNVIDVEICARCEAGSYCINSTKTLCAAPMSNSVPGATECACTPGFVVQNTTVQQQQHSPHTALAAAKATVCMACPPHSICPGGSVQAFDCESQPSGHAVKIGHNWSMYCPCVAGQIRSSVDLTCVTCPTNFFCPGFANMTGIDPLDTVYAERCPDGATSPSGSVFQHDCACGNGFYVRMSNLSHQGQQYRPRFTGRCSVCGVGHYCSSGAYANRTACPPYTTTETDTSQGLRECVCQNTGMSLSQTSPPRCVCKKGWLQTSADTSAQGSPGEACVRCEDFPANTSNIAGALVCTCAPGFFENTQINQAVLQSLLQKVTSADHPLSPELRTMLRSYDARYHDLVVGQDYNTNSDISTTTWSPVQQQRERYPDIQQQRGSRVRCVVCPPNFYCLGASNPPAATMQRNNGSSQQEALLYGILPVGASGPHWWVPCPDTGNPEHLVLSRGNSLSLASCFSVAQRWSSHVSLLEGLTTFVFPCLLYIHTGMANTLLLTSIINQEQLVYRQQIFAVYEKRPVIQRAGKQARYAGYFVTIDIDMISVVNMRIAELSHKAHSLMERLTHLDQGTGAAFSTLLPLLWACTVSQHIEPDLAQPIMIVPGIVRNSVTERIVARTVTVVMSVLELECPRPKYIFQLDSAQIMSSDSLQVHQHVLHYVHNHICAGFSVDQTQTVQQYQYDCEVKFKGTLLSSYNPRQNVQIPLSQLEHIDFAHTQALHTQLNIGGLHLQRTNLMPCPPNLFTKFSGGAYDNIMASVNADCFVCRDAQFFDILLRTCMPCDVGLSTCEDILPGTVSSPCSWTSDLHCSFALAPLTRILGT